MKIAISKIVLLLALLLTVTFAIGQEKESEKLKRQQQELESKISFTENLIKTTENSKADLSGSITLISNKIQYREALLNNITVQLKSLNSDIKALNRELELLDQQLVSLEQQYKNMLIQTYKMRSESATVFFIISSTNFNQATKRLAYINQLTKYRADQIQRIKRLREEIEAKRLLVSQKKLDQESLIKNKEKEKTNYQKDRERRLAALKNLEGKEQKLQTELLAQKAKAADIKKAINAAIRKEIEAARKKEKAQPKTLAETKEIALSNSGFEGNKGKLPWPVAKGEITKGYGKQAHPVHAGVFTYNKGLDISTVKGASVRAVYKGEVTSVINIPGAGKAVIIAHGNYRTIYSNLQTAYVQAGDKIETKQEIGALITNADGSLSEVHFEIIKISNEGQITNLNPSYWIYQ
ncbi:MAG: peptidoglycan DD-metalloendopeptidase family protein [Putridiphycobacter sp.]|nr:peptidoglycan DD-metalloendopeptidase family protein [Putridiphycobacter sp.]